MLPDHADTRELARHRLCQLLAAMRFLRHWYETMHWTACGTPQYGDHLLYERLYDSADANIDALAEKIIQTFGSGALRASENLRCMMEFMLDAQEYMDQEPGGETPGLALLMEQGFQDLLQSVFDELDLHSALTMGMNDFLMSLASHHETHLYLLQQRLGGSAELAGWPAEPRRPVSPAPGKHVSVLPEGGTVCEHGHVHSEPHVCGVDCDDDAPSAPSRFKLHERDLVQQFKAARRTVATLPTRTAAPDREASRKVRPHLDYLMTATKVLMQDPPARTADDDLAVALRKAVVACADLAKQDGNSVLSSRLNRLTGRIQVPEVIVSALQPRQALTWAVKRGLPTGPLSEAVMWLGTYIIHLSGQHPVLKDVGTALSHASSLTEEG